MKAARFHGRGDIRVEEVPDPQVRPGTPAGGRRRGAVDELTGASADGLKIFASMAEAVDGRVAA